MEVDTHKCGEYAIECRKMLVIADPSSVRDLEAQHWAQSKHRLRHIALVMGMPVPTDQNFGVGWGVANGGGLGFAILDRCR